MIRRLYQYAAAGCAEVVSRVPALEQPFVRFGARAWAQPVIGRFYRSAADRLAQEGVTAILPRGNARLSGFEIL